MDRRFMCQDCRTKWFIPEHRSTEPDLTECGRCGGPLVRFFDVRENREFGADLGEGAGEFDRAE